MLHWLVNILPGRFSPKPPYKISIRAELTALVSIVAIISLVILAITTGVYFTSNYKDLRSNRLYIAAQLKSSQLDQTLNYLFFQCYYVSNRDTLQASLANYVAGNKSESNWVDTQSVVEKFLSSSNLFSVARVYDSSFSTVLNATNNSTGDLVPESVLNDLFPLSTNMSLPSSLDTDGILTDPVMNGTNYLMSMSLPIFANPSIILTESRVFGYITIVMSAEGLLSVFNDTTALEKSNVAIVSARRTELGYLAGYHFVFPPFGSSKELISTTFALRNGTFLNSAFRTGKGGSLKSTKFFYTKNVAVGYSSCTFQLVNWVAVVSQAESVFLSPSTKLAKIIAGTVVAIGVFVMLVTFPLAHWAVKPIVRLQKATELITEGRGLRSTVPGSHSASRNNSIRRTSFQSSRFHFPSGLNPSHRFDKNDHTDSTSMTEKAPSTPASTSISIIHESIQNSVNNVQHPRSPSDITSVNRETNSITADSNDRFSTRSRNLTTSTNLIEARVPLSRTLFADELTDLTETFNTMTDALDQHYALLEDRVRARTKQLEAAKIEAETANEAKTVFIANISHELRTPLNGILGMAAISMEEDDIDKIRNSLKLIFRSGELLLHILTELLTFSKNVLKRTKLEKRNFCITDVALQIKSIFGKIAKDQHVRLSIILSPNFIRTMILYGDSNRIIQIVMNLVSNALKFTPEDGKVNARIKLLGEYDAAMSEKFNHKKVYVKRGSEFPDENASTRLHHKVTDTDITTDTVPESSTDASKEEHNTTSGNENGSSESDKEEEDEDDDEDDGTDSKSLASASTRSYDDTVFNSQFKKTPNLYEDGDDDKGVELKDPKTWVISIEVEDTGSGIDKSLHDSVFEPFVQGDQTLSRQYGGTGLGLSICRQLATMMHGTMELESEVGVGSKFTFTVPLLQTRELKFDNNDDLFEDEFNAKSRKNRKVKFKVARSIQSRKSRSSIITAGSSSRTSRISMDDVHETVLEEGHHPNEDGSKHDSDTNHSINDSQDHLHMKHAVSLDRPFLQSTGTATSSRSVPSLATTGKSLKILVAEDNHVNQEVIKRMLNLEGINNIELACDGQEAFDKVKELLSNKESYDMIFMDVQMPKVDGLLSTKLIRQDLEYKAPIVALTAFADDSNIKECIDSGMDGFLSKPIKRPQLKTIIKEYCPGWEPPVKKNITKTGPKPKPIPAAVSTPQTETETSKKS